LKKFFTKSTIVRCCSMAKIVVCGSINSDFYFEVDRMPVKGETIQGTGGNASVGGKGANSAVAASLLGGQGSSFVGVLGDNPYQKMLEDTMGYHNVDMSACEVAKNTPCGQAYIFLTPDGDNSIVIVNAANACWPSELTDKAKDKIKSADVVMLQREVPEKVNAMCAKYASRCSVPVLMDAGGAERKFESDLLEHVWCMSPNETELARMTGLKTSTREEVVNAAVHLQKECGVQNVLVKLGPRGCLLITEEGKIIDSPAMTIPRERVIDTTGAGDTFTGAFAAAYFSDKDENGRFERAMQYANCAGGLCVQVKGTIPSIPSRETVLETLKIATFNKL